MYFKKTAPAVLSFCFILLASCSASGWSTGYSRYGFYSSPDETVATLSERESSLSSAEHFILANAYKEKGDFKKASVHYANSAFVSERNLSLKPFPGQIYNFMKKFAGKSDYYEDAAYQLSVIFNYYSEFEYAEKFASLVGKDDFSLYREAILSRARALDAKKKYNEAANIIRTGITAMPKNELTPVLYIRLAVELKKMNDLVGAVKAYNEVLSVSPDGWQAAAAGKELYDLVKDKSKPSSFDIILTARGLAASKEYDDVLKLLEGAETASPGIDSFACAELRVKAFTASGKSGEADKIIDGYDKATIQFSKLMSEKADMLWQKGNRSEAARIYEQIVKGSPMYDYRTELRRLCFYFYENNLSETPAYCAKYAELYPEDRSADKMLWLAAKHFVEKKESSTARIYLEKIISKYPDGEYSGNARFWIWKFLTAENKYEEAEKVFREMPLHSGGSAYTWILMNRRKDLYTSDFLVKLFEESTSLSKADNAVFAHAMMFVKNGDKNAFYARIRTLSSMGLNPRDAFNNEALSLKLSSEYALLLNRVEKYYAAGDSESIARVLNAAVSPENEDAKLHIEKDKALILASFGSKYSHSYSQLTGITSLFDLDKIQENIFLMNEQITHCILPTGFSDLINPVSDEYNVEKSKIYSIIKAESAFNQKAVSSAGAIGLMQLMPITAKEISKNTKTREYDMKNPADAVRFGTFYLGWLSKYFKGNFSDMVAGYNAGAGNVNKWRKQYFSGDEDLYTEQVPFDETRSYILKTQKYLLQYRLLLQK
jgi:soluble lytic murein transglycosylase